MSQRLLHYARIAAVPTAALPLGTALADIHVFETDQVVGGIGAGASFQSLDGAVAFRGSGTGRWYQFSDWSKYTMWVSQAEGWIASETDGGKSMVGRLSSGEMISSGRITADNRINLFATDRNGSQGWDYKYGNFNSTDRNSGFIGFSFESAGGSTRYGWAEIDAVTSRGFKVLRWAYDDTGDGIAAGQTVVPGPGAAGLFALAAGAAGMRRKRAN